MDNRELIETARHAGIHLLVSGAAAAAVLIGYLSGFHGVSLLVGVFGLATLGSGWRMLRAVDKARAEPQPTPARAPAGVDPTPSPADDLVAQTPRGAPAAIAAFDDQRDPVDAWQDLVDTLPDPVVVTMPDGTIAHFNPAFADHYPRARAGSALIAVLRSPELSDALDDLTEGDMPRLVVIEDRVPVQRQWSAIASALPGRMDHGEDEGDAPGVSGHLVMLRDMTEQQRHAQQRSDFIAYASHELRTPLATLKSMTETLLGPARNDEAARDRFLGMMAAQADR
ncbi:MAG: histidine kinase dimerization/phospho-acceptor domain-containing protein, partial [Pseudomonadota bacterium]